MRLIKEFKKPKVRTDEPLHAEDSTEDVFLGKINKYGFLHVNKKLAERLGIERGKDKSDVPCAIELLKEESGFVKLKNVCPKKVGRKRLFSTIFCY